MAERSTNKRRAPVALIMMLSLLTTLTIIIGGGIVYGFYAGWLIPYWNNLNEAHATIIAQLIFFFAAAWASLLVPLLFREQLRNIEDAANRAETLMKKTAEDSKTQFESITRFQIMSMGYLVDPRMLDIMQSPLEMRQFVDGAWDRAKVKIDRAIETLHHQTQKSINAQTYRSTVWWGKVRDSGALGASFDTFKLISDKQKKQKLEPTDLHLVNDATRRTQDFDAATAKSAASAPVNGSVVVAPTPIIADGSGVENQLPN